MAMTIEVPPALEDRLRRAADRRGVEAPDFARSLMEDGLEMEEADEENVTLPTTGAELVASLQAAGVIGAWANRTDIGDSSEFARTLREKAQRRQSE